MRLGLLSSYQFYVNENNTAGANHVLSNHPECFGGSSTTSQVQINSTSFQQTTAISGARASRFLAFWLPPPARKPAQDQKAWRLAARVHPGTLEVASAAMTPAKATILILET